MKKTIIKGQVIPINESNIDTDIIIPKQYLKSIKKTGFGPYLFDSWRYEEPGELDSKVSRTPKSKFILNKKPYSNGKILLVGDNFGCGSSREHAVWAIKDYGIDAVISPSFADIFFRNSIKNQLLPIKLEKQNIINLFSECLSSNQYELTIDIEKQTITSPNNEIIKFNIDANDKDRIMFGYDDIELTLKNKDKILSYENNMKKNKPWLFKRDNEK